MAEEPQCSEEEGVVVNPLGEEEELQKWAARDLKEVQAIPVGLLAPGRQHSTVDSIGHS